MTLSDVFIRRSSQKQDLTDDELMKHVKKGDNDAFRILYDRYKGQMFLYCLRMIGDRDRAKDVLQEIFIRVHTRRERYEAGTNFNGWLHTIARNLCLNSRRDAKDHTSFDENESYGMAPATGDPDIALQEHVAGEIARLPEIYREIVILREYEGHSYQEIVTLTGLAMSTVKFRLFKAREILRERLSWGLGEL